MILAGVDEAGYGPLLGPLVVGCCAFEIPAGLAEASGPGKLPCLWKQLRRVMSKSRPRKGRKLHVNDSKVVYSSAMGLKELEKSILSLVASAGGYPDGLPVLLARVAGDACPDLANCQWYSAELDQGFPIECEAASIRTSANGLRIEMERCGIRLAHLAARVLPERQFNAMVDKTRNKASALFSLAAIHLDHLLRHHGEQDLVIFCDRQGGREHYGHLLRLMFEEWSLSIVCEGDGHSEYVLERSRRSAGSRPVRIIFEEKAEGLCMSVAVASMLSKYLREALMRRFNAWWRRALPGVEPTAGYYSDGARFLRDIEARRVELGISQEQLVRMR